MGRGTRRRNRRGRSILSAPREGKFNIYKIRFETDRGWTYSAEFGEKRDEVRAASAFELLFEEIDIYENIRHRVFIHHRCISIRERILFENQTKHIVSSRWGWGGTQTQTHHEALSDVRCCGLVRLVLVRVVDLERVDDGREPVYELVEVHARCVFARRRRPDVLGETEEIVELEVDQRGYPCRGACLSLAEGRRGGEADRTAAL